MCIRAFLLFLGVVAALYPQTVGRNYGRSMVITQQGIAATSQTLASQAGAQVLAKGGSAVDARIAGHAVLPVMESRKNGLGREPFAVSWAARARELARMIASAPGTTPL